MTTAELPLEITLGNEKFRMRAPAASHRQLQAIGALVNERVAALHNEGGALTVHRAALMAAFQFAFEAREISAQSGLSEQECQEASARIESLISQIEEEMHG